MQRSTVSTSIISLHDALTEHTPHIPVTRALIVCNVLVFVVMLFFGAGFLHSPNAVQLAWGANFAPATEDGQWWRLFTAMFLHFGVVHLAMNMWALWDCGRLVERMYGRGRFLLMYVLSGLLGNLLSLVAHGNTAISGGASGAVFSLYGALITFLWREREQIDPYEFRWLFWGAIAFTAATILMGVFVSGIDNYAHIGGFLAGCLSSIVWPKSLTFEHTLPTRRVRILALAIIVSLTGVLIAHIPKPSYRWSDELRVQQGIRQFFEREARIQKSWQEIVSQSKQGGKPLVDLADSIETHVTEPYEASFEALSKLPNHPTLPSAATLNQLLQYTEARKEKTKAVSEALKERAAAGPRISSPLPSEEQHD